MSFRWVFLAVSAVACATADGPGPDPLVPGSDALVVDAPPPPDAPRAIDGPNPSADARPDAVLGPDAPPVCTPSWTNLLANGGFDSGPGTGWLEASSGGFPIVTSDLASGSVAPVSGAYAAWFGGYYPADDRLWQTVVVPGGTTALRLKGYRFFGSEEFGSTAYDFLRIELRNAGGAMLETLDIYSNLDASTAWMPFDLAAVSPHAGETVQLFLHGTTDDSLNTNFFLDSLALEALACP